MANSKELCLREWAPLTEILELIPVARRGFFPANLNITCIDAIEDYLALGSDAGIVFWYNRRSGEMQKLKGEVCTRITCVKIVNSVEYMVAAGSANGQVSVFQIQKELPPDLDLVAPCTRSKPIERYTIRDLHRCVVSCCEWSKNGMKLYSGDRQGVVVLTEFDYQTHTSKSLEILSEAYEIVQLSVHKSYLLVATLYRCIVCRRDAQTHKWQITQVGKKDRKQLIDCGGLFLKNSRNTNSTPQIVCGRPGLRFWVADAMGNVSKTIIFNETVLRSPTWEIPLLNPKQRSQTSTASGATTSSAADGYVASKNFREMELYDGRDSLLVTHDDAALYILNLERLKVEAVARGFRKILDFCVCGKEIFVLEGERSLLRLAPLPEKPNKTAKVIFNPLMPPPLPMLGATHYSKMEVESPVELVEPSLHCAEECFELPPIEKLDLNVPIELAVESPLAQQNRRLEIFKRIGEQDFDQSILHSTGGTAANRKRKVSVETRQNGTIGGIVEIGQETQEQQKVPQTSAATLMDASYCQLENDGLASPLDIKAAFIKHLPDALTPTTLQKTIEEKAKTLAEELDLPEVHLAPITVEELLDIKKPQISESLINAYPTKLEAVGVQTTPHKNTGGDYSAGQPVDGICAGTSKATTSLPPLKFVATQPNSTEDLAEQEYSSFLPDFRNAGDPFRKPDPGPATTDSSTSSEWEFLDN